MNNKKKLNNKQENEDHHYARKNKINIVNQKMYNMKLICDEFLEPSIKFTMFHHKNCLLFEKLYYYFIL